MSTILESISRIFSKVEPISPGTYHYQAPQDDPRNYRLHLRIEKDGAGILIVNAATVLHLNQTAAEYAYYLVSGIPGNQAVDKVTSRYNINHDQALKDYQNFIGQVDTLITVPDLDPVTYLDFDRQEPYSGKLSAPYRLDCALTYTLPESAKPEAAPTKRVTRELTTKEWKSVLDKAWHAGIPHVIFTGGEPTLRNDLVEIIDHAENNGQVTGLITDGSRLINKEYLDSLLQTGLDHLLIILHSQETDAWNALQDALGEDIFTAVHLTITADNKDQIHNHLQKLAEMEISAISLSAAAPELNIHLKEFRQLSAELNLNLVWDLPVPYTSLNPVALELEDENIEVPDGAGNAWLYVEPDGDVLPTQGVNKIMGNILTDTWDTIWKSS